MYNFITDEWVKSFSGAHVIAPNGDDVGIVTGFVDERGDIGECSLHEALIGMEAHTATHIGKIAMIMVADGVIYFHACPCDYKFDYETIKAFREDLSKQMSVKCTTCDGTGAVGGLVNADQGYQTDPCPDCTPASSERSCNTCRSEHTCIDTTNCYETHDEWEAKAPDNGGTSQR